MAHSPELQRLLDFSARIGRDPLLTQASSGNTSLKIDGKLWIKASGTWLANATAGDTFLPLPLADAQELKGIAILPDGQARHTSVETHMHAVLPYGVVVHVHSVNTIAWAVRFDGPECLRARLMGLNWVWTPYLPSGLPLARSVQQALVRQPGANVFVLANHGLVVCGNTCKDVEELLRDVERRVAAPIRTPLQTQWDMSLWRMVDGTWTLPESTTLHRLATDPTNYRIATGGILFPCQAMFLGPEAIRIERGKGILVNRRLTVSQQHMLDGLLQVVQRIDADAPIRYLTNGEVAALATEDAHQYHLTSALNAVPIVAQA